jgi:hypothetical protein
VPRITPNTERAPRPAPSIASDSAKQFGVVGHADLAAECALEVFLERLAVEASRVGVLHAAIDERARAGSGDADARARSEVFFDRPDQLDDRRDRGLVASGGSPDAAAMGDATGRVERGRFDLRAA